MHLKWSTTFGDYLKIEHQKIERPGIPDINVIFDLEVLHNWRNNPTKIGLQYLEIKYEKVNNPQGYHTICTTSNGLYVPRDKRGWEYLFDCPTGRLEGISRCVGDFRDRSFSWSNRNLSYGAQNIPTDLQQRAFRITQRVREELESMVSHTTLIHDRDKYKSFLEAFSNIKRKDKN